MKIVINRCQGGFGLSHKAIMRYAELQGIKLYWKIDEIRKKAYKEKATPDNPSVVVDYYTTPEFKKGSYFSEYEIERDDINLIKVIEELKEKANGMHAKLKIVEVPDVINWELEERNGMECIAEIHRTWR